MPVKEQGFSLLEVLIATAVSYGHLTLPAN
ncbi:prepilin-type N-terminal cleavage/methylation domain-containing protein [Escherichia coli]|nr:prepilin-type N-terminal cleavage/methylation domain-containing protein [Escherichia coli]